MKPATKTAVQIGSLLVVIALLVATVLFAIKVANQQTSGNPVTSIKCKDERINHTAVIRDEKVTPKQINASYCDTMTITNKDSKERLIAFGVHDKHVAYDGIRERLLAQDESFTVSLTKSGTYLFHDHDDENVGATFVVSPAPAKN